MTQENDIMTLSCRLNAVESEAMRRHAQQAGVRNAVIVNTCAVTNEAVRNSRQQIRRLRRERPDARIIATGCAVQIDPDAFAAMDETDVVIGNHEKLQAQSWRTLAQNPEQVFSVNDIMDVRETAGHMIDSYGDRSRAFLQIQNGCDHRCTFCIIPYGRGPSRSAPITAIVEQARRLVDNGHNEIVLTGVDITSYGADLEDRPSLGALVGAILDNVPDLFRLRLSSIDGAEIDADLLERVKYDSRIAPHLHLSLQAGDNMILKRMKRRHSREQAIALCSEIRKERTDIAFGADIIVGFPTETEEMFQRSLDIVDEAGLQFLHVFPFSPRTGTPAERMPQLERRIIKERAARLRNKGKEALHEFLDSQAGKEQQAVIEAGARARLGNFASVKLDCAAGEVGSIANLRINGRDGDLLTGHLLEQNNSIRQQQGSGIRGE